ncbi:MAG: hypothetical protein AABW91_02620 [Nanoarchaeota archaeon]
MNDKPYFEDYGLENDFELILSDPNKEKIDGRILIYSEVSDYFPNFFFSLGGEINMLETKDYSHDFHEPIKFVKKYVKGGFVFFNGVTSNPEMFRGIPGDKLLSDKIYCSHEIERMFKHELFKYRELYNQQSEYGCVLDSVNGKKSDILSFSPFEMIDVPGYSFNPLIDISNQNDRRNNSSNKIKKNDLLDYIYRRYLLEHKEKISLLDIYSEFSSSQEDNIDEIQSLMKDLFAEGAIKQLFIKDRNVLSCYVRIN